MIPRRRRRAFRNLRATRPVGVQLDYEVADDLQHYGIRVVYRRTRRFRFSVA